MGRLLLLLVGATALAVPTLLFGSAEPATSASESALWSRSRAAVAREIALSGLGDAEARLSQEFASRHAYTGPLAWQAAYAGGAFGVEIDWQDSLYVVTSRGVFEGREHHVRRAYRPQAHVVPPFVRQALLVEKHIQISHRLHAWAMDPGNANVHANGHLMVRDITSLVTGFGTASGNLHAQRGISLPLMFRPNYNPDRLPSVADRAPVIPIPPVDPTVYRPLATRVLPGGSRLGGRVRLGTRTAPAVWYVDGTLGTSAPVEFDGWGMLVVAGSFTIEHALTSVGDEARSRLLVVTGGNVQVRNDGTDLSGAWVVGGNLQVRHGTRLLGGGFTVRNQYMSPGAVEIAFREVPISLAGLAWPDHVVARSYREW